MNEPAFDFILQRRKPLRLIVRRDLRDRIVVVRPSTLDAWLLGTTPTRA